MVNRSFEYLRPETVGEAVEMKAAHGARARFWAGGTDLMLLWNRREVAFDYCIDLTYVPALRYIESSGDALRIGAMASLDDLDLKSDLSPLAATLGYTARLMCTKQTRTIATVGGNMCHASPSADLTPPLVAMGARCRLLGPDGERDLPLEDFHLGVNETALADSEMLTEIYVPGADGKVAAHYDRVARTVVDIALVSSAVFLKVDAGNRIERAGVALGAVAPSVIRVTGAEETLLGRDLSSVNNGVTTSAGEEAASAARAISDIRASKEYREDMVATLTARAIRQCISSLEGSA
ncbi:MAG: FAD binding domain-containing protein [bacterium]|nr:FAD binding domain-containing protein [bacterium]